MAGAHLVHLLVHHLASSPPPHLLHLALHVVEVLGAPQPSEEQEDEKAEEDKTEAARQGEGENVSHFEIKVEGDVLLQLSSALLHSLLLGALLLLLLLDLLVTKQQLRTRNHSCAGDSQESKVGVGGGEVDAGHEGGGGGGDQVQLAPCVLGSEEEDGWLGGGEVPCDGAGGEGEGGEEEGRCGWRRLASCLTTSGTEERGRTEGEGGGGGGEEERADFSALHRFSPLQIVLLHVAPRLAPGCHDLGPEQGFHGGGSADQGEGGDC